MNQTSNQFRLQQAKGDLKNYELVIKNMHILIPVGEISNETFDRLTARLKKENSLIHFRRSSVLTRDIAKGRSDWESEILFSTGSVPCKLVVCLLYSRDFKGYKYSTPFYFSRNFYKKEDTVMLRHQPHPDDSQEWQNSNELSARNWDVEELDDYDNIEESFNQSEASSSRGRGSKRGRGRKQPQARNKSRPYVRPGRASTRPLDDQSQADCSIAGGTVDDIPEPTDESEFVTVTKVTLNKFNTPYDSLNQPQTYNNFAEDYFRMQATLGFSDAKKTNSITMEMFQKGAYFKVFDLTTSGDTNLIEILPAVKTGDYNLDISFSDPLPMAVTVIMLMEYPSTMKLDGQTAKFSYAGKN